MHIEMMRLFDVNDILGDWFDRHSTWTVSGMTKWCHRNANLNAFQEVIHMVCIRQGKQSE